MIRYALLFLASGLLIAADAPSDEAKKDLKKLTGTWMLASGVDDGEKLFEEALKTGRLTIDGEQHTVKVGDTTFKGTHKLDPTKRPKTIDIKDTEGPYKDKTVLGIYAIDSDVFRICFAPPGKARPKDFSAKAGSGYRSHVWKRVKK